MMQLSVSKWKKILLLFGLLCLLAFVWQILREANAVNQDKLWKPSQHLNDIPLLIWWTPTLEDYSTTRVCGTSFCKFTSHRELLQEAEVILKAMLVLIKLIRFLLLIAIGLDVLWIRYKILRFSTAKTKASYLGTNAWRVTKKCSIHALRWMATTF